MNLITYKSYGWLSWFGIEHAVLVKDEIVLSYEMQTFFGKGQFYVYNKDEWSRSINELGLILEVPDFDLLQYKGRWHKGILCSEGLELIFKENGIMFPETVKIRTKALFLFILGVGLYTLVIATISFLFGYYGFTLSEEDYLLTNEQCLEYKQ